MRPNHVTTKPAISKKTGIIGVSLGITRAGSHGGIGYLLFQSLPLAPSVDAKKLGIFRARK